MTIFAETQTLYMTAFSGFTLGLRDPLKEDVRHFALGFCSGLLVFALGHFGVGRFWKGKELLKGKDC
jgi:hypothetical protein